MNEQKAREILDWWITKENELYCGGPWLAWYHGHKEACLDGDFTTDELEAIGWWIKNAKPTPAPA